MDECYRCGYDLRGIADEQACPECGLLARRSRRQSDELHNTRPRWLRSISRGVKVILLSLLLGCGGPYLSSLFVTRPNMLYLHVTYLAICFVPSLFFIAVWLLTRKEGFAPADRADRRLRLWLRIAAAAQILAAVLFSLFAELEINSYRLRPPRIDFTSLAWAALLLGTVGMVPLPLLLFRHLRSLAKRARSAHLAEHCTIVGIGTSATFLYISLFIVLAKNAERLGLGPYWGDGSSISLFLSLILGVAAGLLVIWSVYLLVRFAIAFHIASRKLRAQWRRDDRSDADFSVSR